MDCTTLGRSWESGCLGSDVVDSRFHGNDEKNFHGNDNIYQVFKGDEVMQKPQKAGICLL